ncbi:hypothetical protein SAMN04487948_13521 [Halogranum amylolyticum]|uniref:Uncharacterized protein n=1 Tax=Halogranum amylolyticum TaxID=660520 RepID=A0A1H8WNH2_9EURY|nr:hypothetical protein SAMN04487948_13521 [Halogranum amylolyticum]
MLRLGLNNLGEGDVLANRLNLHVHNLAGVATVDDNDVAAFDLRDTVTLLTKRLDCDLPDLTRVDRRALLSIWRRIRGGGRLTWRRRGGVREHANTTVLDDVEATL